jgi:protein gp37
VAINSSIEWTQSTWNPVTGCTKISPGCIHCYAERMALRLKAMGQPNYTCGFEVALHRHMLELPMLWKKPQAVFVNSMGDLFHRDVPESFILEVFDVMRRASWHRFQLLTKRSDRLAELDLSLDWPGNVWMGVTVENADYLFRIDHLRSTGSNIKFLSCEPLLGPMGTLNLSGIDWVIVGGESGPGARPIEQSWVIEIRDQCRNASVPFFFKQWGGTNRKKTGRLLEGRTWDELPRNTCIETRHTASVI